jgi:hypothetical protein
MRENIKSKLDRFADYLEAGKLTYRSVTVRMDERYLRRRLGLKRPAPLIYRGIAIRVKRGAPWHGESIQTRL